MAAADSEMTAAEVSQEIEISLSFTAEMLDASALPRDCTIAIATASQAYGRVGGYLKAAGERIRALGAKNKKEVLEMYGNDIAYALKLGLEDDQVQALNANIGPQVEGEPAALTAYRSLREAAQAHIRSCRSRILEYAFPKVKQVRGASNLSKKERARKVLAEERAKAAADGAAATEAAAADDDAESTGADSDASGKSADTTASTFSVGQKLADIMMADEAEEDGLRPPSAGKRRRRDSGHTGYGGISAAAASGGYDEESIQNMERNARRAGGEFVLGQHAKQVKDLRGAAASLLPELSKVKAEALQNSGVARIHIKLVEATGSLLTTFTNRFDADGNLLSQTEKKTWLDGMAALPSVSFSSGGAGSAASE